mgnify:FL=1|nr:MAG TPA: Major capsid protein [Caudoviricetes sp.]
MSVETFIPEVWAKKFKDDLKRKLVFAENTNREYEGIARQVGDTVKVLGLGDVDLRSFNDGKTHKLDAPQEIQGTSMTIPIMEYRDFNFFVDDLDKRQAEGGEGLIGKYTAKAKDKVANEQDKFIAGLVTDPQVKIIDKSASLITHTTILDCIDEALEGLWENDVDRDTEVTITVPHKVVTLLKKAYVDLDTNNSEMLRNGRVGMYGGAIIKASNNVHFSSTGVCDIQVKTNNAISFIDAYLHLEADRPEDYFQDRVKGFSLFDGKVTAPKEIINLRMKIA